MTKPVNLIIDRRILLDKSVAGRNVRFRLVVVVITDEVFNSVLGEKLFHLLGQLRSEALVWSEYQRRALNRFDSPRDGCGFTRTSDAQQSLKTITTLDAGGQLRDRARLISRR